MKPRAVAPEGVEAAAGGREVVEPAEEVGRVRAREAISFAPPLSASTDSGKAPRVSPTEWSVPPGA
jgi:hypothetical protein